MKSRAEVVAARNSTRSVKFWGGGDNMMIIFGTGSISLVCETGFDIYN